MVLVSEDGYVCQQEKDRWRRERGRRTERSSRSMRKQVVPKDVESEELRNFTGAVLREREGDRETLRHVRERAREARERERKREREREGERDIERGREGERERLQHIRISQACHSARLDILQHSD